jgi:amino acid transporter
VLPGRRTPWAAIAFTTVLAAALIASGDLSTLADMTVTLLLIVFAVVNVCVLVLRRDPVPHKHFHAPSILPVIGAIVSLALLTTKDGEVFLRAGLLLLVGVVLYGINWLLHGRHQPAMDTGVLRTVNRPDVDRRDR